MLHLLCNCPSTMQSLLCPRCNLLFRIYRARSGCRNPWCYRFKGIPSRSLFIFINIQFYFLKIVTQGKRKPRSNTHGMWIPVINWYTILMEMLAWSNDRFPDLLSESNNFWSPSRNSNAARLNKVSGEHEYLRLELDATGYLEATTLSRNSATSERYSVSKQNQ